MKKKSHFLRGLVHGIPIALGYLSVSFGFGIRAVNGGLSVLQATLISLLNLTSAGQLAGIDIIAANGTLIEMALVQLTINIRYSLMALSLSQKLDASFSAPHRLLVSYGITDEIFGVAASQKEPLKPSYFYGLMLMAVSGWVLGTFLGAAAGELLPAAVTNALGILMYGMFIAIIIPPARKERGILVAVLIAASLSILCAKLLPMISGGFAVIICAVLAAVAAALIFPRPEEEA
ncbi:MAG: AzlC family ABC transporter permease [Oscillospiraceae bacterium]|nr:AzlC family ABC transporter permease [Oscillospiraceae bacterium]